MHISLKKIIFSLLCISSCTFFATQTAHAAITDNIQGFWGLNETSGNRSDSAGSNTLTNNGSVASTTGKVSNAAQFSGSNDLSITDNSALSTGDIDFTVSGWVYMTSKAANAGIISKFTSSGAQREYLVYYDSAVDRFRLSVSAIGTTVTQIAANNLGSPSLNTWYFIVAWHDSVANTINIQVNNGTADSASYSSGVFDGTAPFMLGNYFSGGVNNRLTGYVDAVGFWKRVLTDGEKTTLYNSGSGIEYPFAAPTAPTNLSATPGDTTMALDWDALSTEAIYDYKVEYKLASDSSWTIFSDGLSTTSAGTVTGLTNGQSYNFRVSAINTTGTSSVSSTATATPNPANTISITTPVSYQVFQRDGSSLGDISITGTYTGSPTAIEASFNGGSFTTIVASPNGGTFSGTLSDQAAGQGTLTVRFVNNTAISSTVSRVGVGDIFVIAGQSNASGRGTNNQVYSHGSLYATMFGNDDVWKDLADPTDSDTNQVDSVSDDPTVGGSVWPLLATHVLADQSVPVAFVPAAKGNTEALEWLPNSGNHADVTTLYGSMYRRIQAVGGSVKAILWFQGEADAGNNLAEATYLSRLTTIVDSMYSDFGVRVVVAQIGNRAGHTAYVDGVRDAQTTLWNTSTHVYPGPVTVDINIADEGGDDLHFKTDAELQTLADRWWAAIKTAYYGGSDARGPRLSSATYTSSRTTITLTFTDESSPVLANPRSIATSVFTVKNNGTPITVSAATITSATTIDLTVQSTASGTLTVSLASGETGGTGNMPVDSSTYTLPAEPFTDHATTLYDPDVTAPVRSAGAPTGTLPYTTTSTTLSLTTDETATCKYSTSSGTAYGSMTAFTTTGSTSHSTTISGLSAATSYTYYVKCVDTSSNTNATDYSISFAVDSDNVAPIVSAVSSSVSGTTATITWTTDETASSQVEYGTTTSYGTTTTETDTSPRVTSHTVVLGNLNSCGTYYFKVHSKDATTNEGISSGSSFTTSDCRRATYGYYASSALRQVLQPRATSKTTFSTPLARGMTSPLVSELQKVLQKIPTVYPEGRVTGYFGPLTEVAVQRFQLLYKIVTNKTDPGFGRVGPKTRQVLNSLSL